MDVLVVGRVDCVDDDDEDERDGADAAFGFAGAVAPLDEPPRPDSTVRFLPPALYVTVCPAFTPPLVVEIDTAPVCRFPVLVFHTSDFFATVPSGSLLPFLNHLVSD